ncbi:hypothetical protein EJ110_NYTH05340 [Nymphaea thermarum]|nr:hypothetical protein EJ110_NYTH05340 [Nymphaea thermarum]
MGDPVIVYYGKGQFNVFTAEGKSVLDLVAISLSLSLYLSLPLATRQQTHVEDVPADMVINAILAAMARHGSSGVAGLNIYHVGTSSTNPLRVDELFDHCYEHFHSFPLIDSQGKFVHIERMKFFDTLEAISSYLSAGENGRLKKAKDMHILRKLSTTYEPYSSYKGR